MKKPKIPIIKSNLITVYSKAEWNIISMHLLISIHPSPERLSSALLFNRIISDLYSFNHSFFDSLGKTTSSPLPKGNKTGVSLLYWIYAGSLPQRWSADFYSIGTPDTFVNSKYINMGLIKAKYWAPWNEGKEKIVIPVHTRIYPT